MVEDVARDRSVAIVAGEVRGDSHKACRASRYKSLNRPGVHKRRSTADNSSVGGPAGRREKWYGRGVRAL